LSLKKKRERNGPEKKKGTEKKEHPKSFQPVSCRGEGEEKPHNHNELRRKRGGKVHDDDQEEGQVRRGLPAGEWKKKIDFVSKKGDHSTY